MKKISTLKRLEEYVVFALFGAMMYISAQIDIIPNVHPLALFVVVLTVVYRFNIWTVLWLLVMLIPRRINEAVAGVLLVVVAVLHGLSFGILYMPVQCYVFFKGNWDLAWIWLLNGAAFDTLHAIGNLTATLFAIPMIRLLCKLNKMPYFYKPLSFKKK